MARPHRPTTPHHHRTSQFFKIYTPTISQDQLRVPPEFMKRIKNRSLGVVYLMGPSGNAWRVSLIKGFFRSGWKGFSSDHRLEHGDFLVFRYDGDACFTVRVFDGTGCEKEACFHAKPVDGEEAEGGELVLCGTPDGKKRRLENGLVVWRGSDEEMVGLEGEVDVKPLSLTYSNCSSVSPNVRRGTYVFSSELRKSCIVKSEALMLLHLLPHVLLSKLKPI
ncbi:hypothetical protein QJS10_CPB15g01713 [Acorus calamus]|uniref:TF-B3 domain-containing protein n=1 Tax=Acorus calamus TaxID=4465 RepID=A0AAV9D9M1_ACOCL|nr:hypothetical protein QJS10_CPB15g01713 [Acorus calamus]